MKFRIPVSWKEEYADIDGGMFHEDIPGPGTLRVKVITHLKAPTTIPTNSHKEFSQPLGRRFALDETGCAADIVQIGKNALLKYQQVTSERGTKLRIFCWVLRNPVPPQQVRAVTFSYTVLDGAADTPATLQELAWLDREIAETEFAAEDRRGRSVNTMREGWWKDDYLIWFDESEIAAANARYATSEFLPGHEIATLKSLRTESLELLPGSRTSL